MSRPGSIFVVLQPGAMAGKDILKIALKHVVRPGEEVHIATCAVCHKHNYGKIAAVLQGVQHELSSILAMNAAEFHFHVLPCPRQGCKVTSCEQAAERLCNLAESLECRAFVLGESISEKDATPTAAMRLGSSTHRWIVRNSTVPVILAKHCSGATSSKDRRPSFLDTGLLRTFSRKSSNRSDTATASTLSSESCPSLAEADTDCDGLASAETSTHSTRTGAADSSIHRMSSALSSVSESARNPITRRLSLDVLKSLSLKRKTSQPAASSNPTLANTQPLCPDSPVQLPAQQDGSVSSSSRSVLQWLSKASFSPRSQGVAVLAPA